MSQAVHKESKHCGGMKPLKEKAKEGEFSGKCQASKAMQQTGEHSSEDIGAEDSNLNEKASSVKTDAKATQDENHVAKTPITRSQKRHYREKESLESPHFALKYDESLIGANIKVWWPDDKNFYAGIVDSYDPDSMRHKVLYVDGGEEDLILKDETFEFIEGVEELEEHDRTLGSGMSRKRANTSASKKLEEVASSKGSRKRVNTMASQKLKVVASSKGSRKRANTLASQNEAAPDQPSKVANDDNPAAPVPPTADADRPCHSGYAQFEHKLNRIDQGIHSLRATFEVLSSELTTIRHEQATQTQILRDMWAFLRYPPPPSQR